MNIVPTDRASGKGATSSDEPGDSWQLIGSPLRTDLEACKLCPIDLVFHVLMTRLLKQDNSKALHNKKN